MTSPDPLRSSSDIRARLRRRLISMSRLVLGGLLGLGLVVWSVPAAAPASPDFWAFGARRAVMLMVRAAPALGSGLMRHLLSNAMAD